MKNETAGNPGDDAAKLNATRARHLLAKDLSSIFFCPKALAYERSIRVVRSDDIGIMKLHIYKLTL